MFHRGTEFIREVPVSYQDHTDHDWTAESRRVGRLANPKAFDVPIVMYQASYA
jgi:hypothetical protein